MHPPSYTGSILATIARDQRLSHLVSVVCAPQHSLDVLSPFALRQALEADLNPLGCPSPHGAAAVGTDAIALIVWAFSAGCVGAAPLVTYWQRHRGPVLALFMVDGWGVPRPPGVPVHRLSHDWFTNDTSGWLGAGDEDFYADPAVPHLTLWQQPQAVAGWAMTPGNPRQGMTAAEFLCGRSRGYVERYQRRSPLEVIP
ncbi:MAG: hypothetical protein EA368_19255 [Leptolyngbya sp. DLM2.Bin27]|nr:MAG: hypothetical protein EA368_19255 [Leptolyngbya sp. DLM2.Bin27]